MLSGKGGEGVVPVSEIPSVQPPGETSVFLYLAAFLTENESLTKKEPVTYGKRNGALERSRRVYR